MRIYAQILLFDRKLALVSGVVSEFEFFIKEYVYINLTPSEYQAALDYQSETGVQLFYPLVNTSKVVQEMNKDNANYWYEHDAKGIAKRDADGNVIPIYKKDETSPDGLAYAASKMGGAQRKDPSGAEPDGILPHQRGHGARRARHRLRPVQG